MAITPVIRGLVTEAMQDGKTVRQTLEEVAAHARRYGGALTFQDAVDIADQVEKEG